MKHWLISCFFLLLSQAVSAQGIDSYYVGLKGGTFTIDASERVGGFPVILDDEESSFGVQVGYPIAGNWSVEVEYITADAKVDILLDPNTRFETEVDVDTFGFYAAYRSRGDLYFLGKAGINRVDLEFDDSTSVTAALGGGYRFDEFFGFEVEYAFLSSDVDYVGFTFRVEL